MPLEWDKPMDELWQNTTGTRLYLTHESPPRVVPEDDPAAAFLLVGLDGAIPLNSAIALGLVDAPKAKDAPANKAKGAPPNKDA
jgi:hypothetical protein